MCATRPRKVCAKFGCLRATYNRFCEVHDDEQKKKRWTVVADRKEKEDGKPREREKLYDTAQWKRLRIVMLSRHPTCQFVGCKSLAKEVDHIKPVSEGGAKFDSRNLQCLCKYHHTCKTVAEARARLQNPIQ